MTETSRDVTNLPETEAKLREFIEQGVISGGILAWGTADGPVRYHGEGVLGYARKDGVDERSIFRVFSQSKPITGIGAMMLIEDGIIGLDQPIGEILPAFAEMRVIEGDDPEVTRPAARPITVRHLLTHTAGFGMDGMTLGELYTKHGVAPGSRDWVPGPGDLPVPATLAELGERIAALPLATDPGTRFDYSVALDVLGLVIEVASGMPFETFLKTRLFDPLGMVDTGFSITADQAARFADLPQQEEDGTWALADDAADSLYARPYYPSGGGGLVSTAHDYSRFAAMLLNEGELDGVRILKPETVRIARSNLLPEAVTHVDVPIGYTLSNVGMGAGMSVSLAPSEQTNSFFDWPGSVPAGVFGWPGAAGTACWMDPERKFFLLYLTQYWPSWLNGSMRPEIVAAAYRDLEKQ